MRRFALLFAVLASPVAADWVPLSGAEIGTVLTGRTLVYPDTTQDLRASGRTLYPRKGRESRGCWRGEVDRYCSQWPPNDLWACYGMECRGETLRLVGTGGEISPGRCMSTERVLADFEGMWTIERDIIPAHGAPARFEGEAEWRRAEADLAYRETGLLQGIGVTPMRAERGYRWCPGLSVYFEDGQFFHKVPGAGGRAVHLCDPDTYVVDYDFGPWPAFGVMWTVKGPRKSYTMTSLFTRQTAP